MYYLLMYKFCVFCCFYTYYIVYSILLLYILLHYYSIYCVFLYTLYYSIIYIKPSYISLITIENDMLYLHMRAHSCRNKKRMSDSLIYVFFVFTLILYRVTFNIVLKIGFTYI